MDFTREQLAIFDFVRSGTGHGIIDAVAGAGKTTTIIESAQHTPAGTSMLFCAFNNSIAKEIARKFRAQGNHAVVVKTIHALGLQILKTNSPRGKAPELKNEKYKTLLASKALEAKMAPHLRRIIQINKLNPDDRNDKRNRYAINSLLYLFRRRLLDINQKFRSTLCEDNLGDFKALVRHFGIFNSVEVRKSEFDQEIAQYYHCHRLLLEAGNALSKNSQIIDFTDMLYLPYVWKQYPIKKYDFIFIDECQDLSRAQLAVALKYGKSSTRILSVGDPRQSIYGFTGADIESFERVQQITKARPLPLTTCFRCPQGVIRLAQKIRSDIIGNKKEEGIVSPILVEEVIDKARPNDLIICRVKAPLVLLVFQFIDRDVKVKIHEDEAQDFIHELRNLFKPKERQQDLQRLPEGFETIKVAVIQRWDFIIEKNAERIVDQTERAIHITTEQAYLRDRLDFLHKKAETWQAECSCVEDMLKKIYSYITHEQDPIRLSSIHRAKGLEENRVFIIDYDKLPYWRDEMQDWEEIQELNLKYVAVTRAKKELYLVESEQIQDVAEEGSLFDDLF
jgi:superfamily I DNA/RNA helicase